LVTLLWSFVRCLNVQKLSKKYVCNRETHSVCCYSCALPTSDVNEIFDTIKTGCVITRGVLTNPCNSVTWNGCRVKPGLHADFARCINRSSTVKDEANKFLCLFLKSCRFMYFCVASCTVCIVILFSYLYIYILCSTYIFYFYRKHFEVHQTVAVCVPGAL
jgi:hypothetical protein